tara:strand:+ start:157 stop:633 length:477 start_codon:yes stop_codon:yes gene_type:complete
MIKYILNLFTSDRLADSDDRNAVIECSSRDFAFNKTKSGYQKVCKERVGHSSLIVSYQDSKDSAYKLESYYKTLNSLSDLVKSRLGIIRFLASGEMGDLDRIQIMQLFDEIDNQVEKIEHDVNQYIRQPKSICQKKQESNRMHKARVSFNYDDFEEVS